MTRWLSLIERADDTLEVEVEPLVTAAVEIVTLHWDDTDAMNDVMWRCLIDWFDHGHLCLERRIERILAAAAHSRLSY